LKKAIPEIESKYFDVSQNEFGMRNIHEERMRKFVNAGLYLVTSQSLSAGRTTLAIVKAAIEAGVTLVQLREKELSTREFFKLAKEIRKITFNAGALLIINDRIDVAISVEADGVHLGQNDFPLVEARRMAPELIIGASTHNIEEIIQVQKDGASYLNIGPIFPTKTKEWNNEFIGVDGLRKMIPYVKISFTVMGGIKKENIGELYMAGARIFAVVTAVTLAPDPCRAASELLTLCKGSQKR